MKIKIKGVYKHYKGNLYIVEDIALNSDNLEKYVIYRALYGDNVLFTRPLSEFLEVLDKNQFPNVKQKYRFELQNIESKVIYPKN